MQGDLPAVEHAVENISCTLYLNDIQYLPDEDGNPGLHEELWTCMLSEEDQAEYGIFAVDIEGPGAEKKWLDEQGAVSAFSILSASSAILLDEGKMFVPKEATVEVVEVPKDDERRRRRLAPKTGTLRTLVVRVIAGNGK